MHGLHTCYGHGPVEATLTLHLPYMSQQGQMDVTIANRGAGPLRLRRLDVQLHLDLQHPEDFQRKEVSWFRNGWQSWSHATTVREDRPTIPLPRINFIYGMKENPAVPRKKAPFVSDMFSVIKIGDEGLMAGAVNQKHFQEIEVAPGAGEARVSLSIDLDGQPMAPSATYQAGGWLFEGERTTSVLGGWWARRKVPVGAPRDKVVGWCSWYERERKITHRYICDTLEVIRATPKLSPMRYVIIDDGYQHRVGDWLQPRPAYKGWIGDTASAIVAAGRIPGIWTAPFIAQKGSRLLAEHPDWFLRRNGKLLSGGRNPHWKAPFYALDLDNHQVLTWLDSLYRQLRSMGFGFFKLDYLYPAALAADRHPGSAGRYQRFQRGLEVIRKAVGDDSYVLGCGCPLAPSIGLVDGMRVSTDVGFRWDSAGLLQTVTGDPDLVGIFPALRNTLARLPFARQFWQVDPDCLMIRKRNGNLSRGELDLYNKVTALAGDLLLVGDDLTRWGSSEVEQFHDLLENAGHNLDPLLTSDQVSPAWLRTTVKGVDSLYCINSGHYQEMASMSRDRLELLGDKLVEVTSTGECEASLNDERVSFSKIKARSFAAAAITVQPGEIDKS